MLKKSYRNKLAVILPVLCVAMFIVWQAVAKELDSAPPAPSASTPSVTTPSVPLKPAPTPPTPSKKAGSKQVASKEPVHITSDTLEAFNDERLIVFSGNAVAIQGDKVIRSNKLLVYYKKGAEEGKEGTPNIGQGGDLDRIEAKGPVRITQLKKIVTGDEAVYYQDDQKIVVSGNAVMREGPNIVKGDRITVLLDENRGIVDAPEKKRVSATIYPAEDGKKKK
jgi:lipopolysaccharide export system protein LptA